MVICDNDSKKRQWLASFIGALKNGQSTMAAFNAVALKSIYNHSRGNAAVAGALVFYR